MDLNDWIIIIVDSIKTVFQLHKLTSFHFTRADILYFSLSIIANLQTRQNSLKLLYMVSVIIENKFSYR